MRVLNRHRRQLLGTLEEAALLLETLATREDRLWPLERWPPMVLRADKGPGSAGGHGPIRYHVESHEPGKRVLFRFEKPRGFNGTHGFELSVDGKDVVLTHTIDMRLSGTAWISWPLLFRPLHDALLEDGLDKAAASMSGAEWEPRPFSPWVKTLRWMLARKRKPRR